MPNHLPWLGLGMSRDAFPLHLGDVISLMPRNMSHCTLTIELELHLHSIAIQFLIPNCVCFFNIVNFLRIVLNHAYLCLLGVFSSFWFVIMLSIICDHLFHHSQPCFTRSLFSIHIIMMGVSLQCLITLGKRIHHCQSQACCDDGTRCM